MPKIAATGIPVPRVDPAPPVGADDGVGRALLVNVDDSVVEVGAAVSLV
jgi:hypothetical protein